jgi:hypothetical protein
MFWSLIYLGLDSPPSLSPSTVVVGGFMFGPLVLFSEFQVVLLLWLEMTFHTCCRHCTTLLDRVSVSCWQSGTFAVYFKSGVGFYWVLTCLWFGAHKSEHTTFFFCNLVLRPYTGLLGCVCGVCVCLGVLLPFRVGFFTTLLQAYCLYIHWGWFLHFVWFDWSGLCRPQSFVLSYKKICFIFIKKSILMNIT